MYSHPNEIIAEVTDLVSSNKKGTIYVLHVDDDASLLEITKEILLNLDCSFEIDCACCVDDALKKLATGSYDIVVSDYEMPEKNGVQFLKTLREAKNEIPFILFTGKGREEVAIQALNLGADGYHNKQGSPETVYGELAHNLLSLVEKTKTKKALEESEKRYRTLMEQAAEAIFVHDTKGKITDINEKASRTLGYTKEELLKMTITEIEDEATDNKKGLMWSKVVGGESFSF
jgi:DNA-binding NtrC family response regulator